MKPRQFLDIVRRRKKDPIALGESKKSSGNEKSKLYVEPFDDPRRITEAKSPSIGPIEHPWRPVAERLIPFLIIAMVIIGVLNIARISKHGSDIKASVTSEVTAGFKAIFKGVEHLSTGEIADAEDFFKSAKTRFEAAQSELWFLDTQKQPSELSASKTLATAESIVSVGLHLSQSSIHLAAFAKNSTYLPDLFLQANNEITLGLRGENSAPRASLTELLKKSVPDLEKAIEEIAKADEASRNISETLVPSSMRDEFSFARKLLSQTSEKLSGFKEDIPAILTLLGDRLPHRYLILLENNNELRAGGGFIGSYMIVDLNEGYVDKFEVHDVYQTDYQLKEFVSPPAEIATVTDRWFMRDSNYSPDFAISGAKAAWFLEKSKGPSSDTVIGLTTTMLEDLLDVIGPVDFGDFEKPITRKNFNTLFSYIIEEKIAGRDDPKKILKDFIPRFKEELFKKATAPELAAAILKNIRSRNLVAYSKDAAVERFLSRAGVNGSLAKTNEKDDYLQVVFVNVGGNKSDRYMNVNIRHDSFILKNGRVENELTISKKHSWNLAAERQWYETIREFGFKEISEATKEVLGRGKNVTFARIYVPVGAELISINENPVLSYTDPPVKTLVDYDTGKTYFLARIETEHGMTSVIKIRYRLPFAMELSPADTYKLVVQKQIGAAPAHLEKRIFPYDTLKSLKITPSNGTMDRDGVLVYQLLLDHDLTLASLWGR
ncbi:MAG: DUF4012 domain-containing protein [Patescibacteria group bacterium]